MTILAIDPGYEQSAWVLFDVRRVVEHGSAGSDGAAPDHENHETPGYSGSVVLEVWAMTGMVTSLRGIVCEEADGCWSWRLETTSQNRIPCVQSAWRYRTYASALGAMRRFARRYLRPDAPVEIP